MTDKQSKKEEVTKKNIIKNIMQKKVYNKRLYLFIVF